MSEPRISVIIPTFNGSAWLRDCLKSVLTQTRPPDEVVVVDDGSTDESPAILASFAPRIRVVRQANGGIGAARNTGLAAATGDYLAFIDCDDRWRAEKLDRQLRFFLQRPELALCYTDAEEFDDRGMIHASFFDLFPALCSPDGIFEAIVDLSVPLTSTVMLRADFLKQHRLQFCPAASGVEDVGLFLEIAACGGRFGCLERTLTDRRLHGSNISKNHFNRFAKRVRLYQELLGRTDLRSEHRRALRRGLRQAHYRVGEWHWGQIQLVEARAHLDAARGWDRVGVLAACYGLASRLPAGVVRRLQQGKRRLTGAG